jgi:hypothetical protein
MARASATQEGARQGSPCLHHRRLRREYRDVDQPPEIVEPCAQIPEEGVCPAR